MAWYDSQSCAVCNNKIGKRYFWQDKPRLVGPNKEVLDCAYVDEDKARALAATHKLVCHACYLNRFGDVQALLAPKS
jgi:hypothetical protein